MMFIHTWQQVMDGSKSLTGRIVKPGDEGFCLSYPSGNPNSLAGGYYEETETVTSVYNHAQNYVRWQVGKTYAVQPGRGKSAIGRIQLLAIRRYDVRDITADEARREGFQTEGDFWFTWVTMHDKHWLETYRYAHDCGYLREYGFYSRPAERYQAWQLEFKLVTE